MVVPSLHRFPRIGPRHLANPPQSAKAMTQLAALTAGTLAALHKYLHANYLISAQPQTPISPSVDPIFLHNRCIFQFRLECF